MAFRREKVSSLLKDIVSSFIRSKIKAGIIVSVTRIEISNNLVRAVVFITVFPEEKEGEVLELLQKETWALRNYAKPRLKMKFLPHFEIEIDWGEKNRQRLENILAT